MEKIFNGKKYKLRQNTEKATKKELKQLGEYGKSKNLISSYRIVKENGVYRLYILSVSK